MAVQLGVDPKKSDQVVRGSVVLPSGTGKTVRVAVFTQGAKADEARAAVKIAASIFERYSFDLIYARAY